MQTQTLILIKCWWLGRVKRKQQHAGIRKLYSPPVRCRPHIVSPKFACFPPMCSNTPFAPHACFVFPAGKRLSAFPFVWPESWCFHLVTGGSPSFWRTAAFFQELFARDKSKSTWRLMQQRGTFTDPAEHKHVKMRWNKLQRLLTETVAHDLHCWYEDTIWKCFDPFFFLS